MKTTVLLCGVALFFVVIAGCNSTPTVPAEDTGFFTDFKPRGRRGFNRLHRLARGHFSRQMVERTDPSGNVSTAEFRAVYVVFENGDARGGMLLEEDEMITVFRITAGEVVCVEGKDVVLLSGVATEIVPGADPTTSLFEASATPVGEANPACILWDIKDGCGDAQGDYVVLDSACSG